MHALNAACLIIAFGTSLSAFCIQAIILIVATGLNFVKEKIEKNSTWIIIYYFTFNFIYNISNLKAFNLRILISMQISSPRKVYLSGQ